MPKALHIHLKRLIFLLGIILLVAYVVILSSSIGNAALREKLNPADLARVGGKFAQIDDAQIYYEYHRSPMQPPKATVLLLHGFGVNLRTWDNQIGYLQTNYDVLAVDMLGFGLSQDIGSSVLGNNAQVTMLGKLLDQLAISKVYVIGHSLGGAVAQTMALDMPQKVQGLVLIDSLDLSGMTNYQTLGWLNNPLLAQIPVNLLLNQANLKVVMQQGYGDPTKVTDDEVQNNYLPYTLKNSVRNLIAQLFAPSTNRIVETGLITQPALIIRGEKDAVISKQSTDNLKLGLPHNEYVEIAEAGHGPQQEAPVVTNEIIGDWLARQTK